MCEIGPTKKGAPTLRNHDGRWLEPVAFALRLSSKKKILCSVKVRVFEEVDCLYKGAIYLVSCE